MTRPFDRSDVAQLVEQVTVNHRATGSSPVVGASFLPQPIGGAALVTPAKLHLLAEDDLACAFRTAARVGVLGCWLRH